MTAFVAESTVRTGVGARTATWAAWCLERVTVTQGALSAAGLGADAARRAAVLAVGLWAVVSRNGTREWGWNSALIACLSGHEQCVNLASVAPDLRLPIAVYRNAAAHAADFVQLVSTYSEDRGVNYLRWMGTGDVSAIYRFDQEWNDGDGVQWAALVAAARSVAAAAGVTGFDAPDAPRIAPVEVTRSGGGFGGGTAVAGGGSSGGGAGGGSTGSSGGGGGSSGGGAGTGTGGPSGGGAGTGLTGATQDVARGTRGRSMGLALAAVVAVMAISADKPKGKR